MGFMGPVSRPASGLPPGVTIGAGAATPAAGAQLLVAADATAPAGMFVFTLTGTSGSLVHEAHVALRLTDSGSVDGTFGAQGLATLPQLGTGAHLSRITVLADGAIIAG